MISVFRAGLSLGICLAGSFGAGMGSTFGAAAGADIMAGEAMAVLPQPQPLSQPQLSQLSWWNRPFSLPNNLWPWPQLSQASPQEPQPPQVVAAGAAASQPQLSRWCANSLWPPPQLSHD